MKPAGTLALVLLALSPSACGGHGTGAATSSAPAHTSATSASARTTTPTTTTITTTVTATATASTAPTVALPRCVASELALSFLGQQGATGHGLLGFALRNTSRRSCRTFGYPGILFLSRFGGPLPTLPTRTTHDFFGPAPETALVLAPRASASFRVGVTHGVTSTARCRTAYGLQVIPPDDTATLRTAIPSGAFECRTATVSPLRPGLSAYR
jgi:hypothetical protein